MAWFWDLPDIAARAEITASPLRVSLDDLAGLPPALVVDENDVLRDEGEAYVRKLTAAGVHTTSASRPDASWRPPYQVIAISRTERSRTTNDRRAAGMNDFPSMIVPVDHTAPVPRRIRAMLGNRCVVDTTNALYLWEWPGYPAYYIPVEDVAAGLLRDTGETERQGRGLARIHEAGNGRARVYDDGLVPGRVTFDWDAMDAWFEEDDQVWVHPRSPYHRVDPMRSSRPVRVELDGIVLAESDATVTVFETGLPTRYYFPRHTVNFEHLTPSQTRTQCPYKGRTSEYWSVGDQPDLAWSYDFPTVALRPVMGMVAFLNEQVDLTVDGVRLDRPVTHFSR